MAGRSHSLLPLHPPTIFFSFFFTVLGGSHGGTQICSCKRVLLGPFCFTSTEARWLIRVGDSGEGGGGTGEERVKAARPRTTARKRPWTAARTMEVSMAVSPRPHCPATSALRCFSCRAWAESQGQCPLHCCWATTRSERSPTFAAQPAVHLPTHDLFWLTSVKVQLHLPPLNLLIFWFRLEPCVMCAISHRPVHRGPCF